MSQSEERGVSQEAPEEVKRSSPVSSFFLAPLEKHRRSEVLNKALKHLQETLVKTCEDINQTHEMQKSEAQNQASRREGLSEAQRNLKK